MTGMGPEALLVRHRADPRAELAAYAIRDGSRAEVRAVEERLRRELELLPVRHTLGERLFRWGRKRLRREDVPLAAGPALYREGREATAETRAQARAFAGASLAAMPAIQAGVRPEGVRPPIAAAPVYARP
jgi:hypothetical protein